MNLLKLIASAFVAFICLSVAAGSFYTVDEGERAVLVTNGRVTGVSDPGLAFKMPMITTANFISTRAEVKSFEGLEAYTFDQQIATIESISINYRIPADQVEQVYTEFKTPEAVVDRFVGRRVNEVLEQVFGGYTAEKSVRERAKLSADISLALKQVPDDAPLEIISVQVASISFPKEYNDRINERMSAEVEVAKLREEVKQQEQERLKAKEQADAIAYATKAAAEAKAEAIRLEGNAEAEAIRVKGAALRDNPTLIELTAAQQWNGVLPTTMVPGGATPFVNVGQ